MPAQPAGRSTVDFWVRSSTTATLQLQLMERDDTLYFLCFRAPRDTWQRYRVGLSDLTRGFSPDENNQLDLDQLRFIQIQDTGRYFGQPGEQGPRKPWLDGFSFTQENTVQRRRTEPVGDRLELFLDDFDGAALGWEGRVSPEMSLRKEGNATYLRCRNRPGDLNGCALLSDHIDSRYALGEAVSLAARSTHGVTLSVQVREWDGTFEGPDYAAAVALPAGREWRRVVLPFSAFKPAGGANDASGTLDLLTVWLFDIRDVTAPAPAEPIELDFDRITTVLPK